MNLDQLTAAYLDGLMTLVEQKEKLEAELAKLNYRIGAYVGNQGGKGATGSPASRPVAKGRKAKRAARGSLKTEILSLIQGAGEGGIKVTEIAKTLGLSANRIYTWFYSTGNKVPEIRKVGPACYAWGGGAAKVRPAPAPRPPQSTKPVKPRG